MSFRNILGTTLASFKISLSGPTIYQGSADPTMIVVSPTLTEGDLYIRRDDGIGGGQFGLWIYDGAPDWFEVGTTFVGGSVVGDLDVSQQVRNGDPFIRVNAVDPGPGMTTGTAGVEVERNGTYANWEWDEGNMWWEPTGASQQIHAGGAMFLGDGTAGVPSLSFASLPGYGIYFDSLAALPSITTPSIVIVTGTSPQWTINQFGVIAPAGSGREIGTAGIPVNRVYAVGMRTSGGALGSVAYGFTSDNNTGMWSDTINEIGFSLNSADVLRLDTDGLHAFSGTLANPAYAFQGADDDKGMYVDTNILKIASGSADRLVFDTVTEFGAFPIQVGPGSLGSPGVQVGQTGVQGLYKATGDHLGLITNSFERLRVQSDGLLVVDPADTLGGGGGYEALVTAGGDDSIPNKKWVTDNAVGSPDGANMEIQYNNAGAFGASADFTWNDATKVLTIGEISIDAPIASAGAIQSGYDLTIESGVTNTSGSNLNLNAGDSTDGIPGGNIILAAGAAGTGVAGSVTVTAGNGLAGTAGGAISIAGGVAGSASAGTVSITGGAGNGGTPEFILLDFTLVSGATLTPGPGIGNYFDVDSTSTAYRVWFNDAGTPNTPPGLGGRTPIIVPFAAPDINQIVSNNVVAALIATGDPDFAGATNLGGTTPLVSVALATVGNVPDPTVPDGTFIPPPIVSSTDGTPVGDPDGVEVRISGGDAASGGIGGDVILRPGLGSPEGYIELQPKSGGLAPELRFQEDDGGTSAFVGLKAPGTVTTPQIWTLPQDDPSTTPAGENMFVTDAAGVISIAQGPSGNFPVFPHYPKGALPPVILGGAIFVFDGVPAIGPPGVLCFGGALGWIDVTTSLPVV